MFKIAVKYAHYFWFPKFQVFIFKVDWISPTLSLTPSNLPLLSLMGAESLKMRSKIPKISVLIHIRNIPIHSLFWLTLFPSGILFFALLSNPHQYVIISKKFKGFTLLQRLVEITQKDYCHQRQHSTDLQTTVMHTDSLLLWWTDLF